MEDHRPMNMKPMVAVASLVMLAGCTSQSGGDDDPSPATEETTAADTAPQVVDGQPIEFELEAPEGFTLVADEDRPDLMAENHVSYMFAAEGAGEGDRLMVTSYVLDEPVPAGDFDGLVTVVAAYDEQRGQDSATERYVHALVSGVPAVHRYIEIDDAAAKQYSHYLAVDSHLIQITCQWQKDYGAVMRGCAQLEQNFPVPDGWGTAA